MLLLYRRIIIMILAAEFVGVVGSLYTTPAIPGWYASLAKPDWTPPSWLFAPVWTALYAMMGIAAALVLCAKSRTRETAMHIYGTQLMLNILWSILFFGMRSPFLGLVGIIALWMSIVFTIFFFHRVSRKAAILLVPYLAWTSFALILNGAVLSMNP